MNSPLVIPWVVIHETSSLEITLAMDTQTLTGVRVIHGLVGKAVQTLQSQNYPDSRVRGQWTRYGLVTMISWEVNSLMSG